MEKQILYHGSKKSFEQFDSNFSYGSKRRAVIGAFWFSDNLHVAKSYGNVIYESTLEIINPFIVDANFVNYADIYLGVLPKEICDIIDYIDNRRTGDTYNELAYRRYTEPDFCLRFDSSDLAFSAKRAGYDSIIIQNVIDAGNSSALKLFATTYAVFNPDQIVVKNILIKENVKRRQLVSR